MIQTTAGAANTPKRHWEMMTLTKVGHLGDIMQGGGGTDGDGGVQDRAQAGGGG